MAAQFVLYLAKITQEKMEEKEQNYIEPKKQLRHKQLVGKAVHQMEKYLADDLNKGEDSLRTCLKVI